MSLHWRQVAEVRGPSECWNWLGPIASDGSPRLKKALAHRHVYELEVGKIPPRHYVTRVCGNRTCVNPNHLEAVSVRENRLRALPASDRFWSKVAESGDCWTWTASRNAEGYGLFGIHGKNVLAHRYAYETMRAEIPDGLMLDHLCRVRSCVNPWHLEPVTALVNAQRSAPAQKSECINGHPYTGTRSNGRRRCLVCHREYERARYQRSRTAMKEQAS